eukprot:1859752-Rhodomonas_salina.1
MGAEQERGASGGEGVLEADRGGTGRILTGEHAARGGVGGDRGQCQTTPTSSNGRSYTRYSNRLGSDGLREAGERGFGFVGASGEG